MGAACVSLIACSAKLTICIADPMTLDEFRQSFTAPEPPAELTNALAGLWWDGKGDWTRAHESAQQDEGKDGSWVHAYLQGRRSRQRSVLVRPSGQARLPGTARCGMDQHRDSHTGKNSITLTRRMTPRQLAARQLK